jgi:hypothetical protein
MAQSDLEAWIGDHQAFRVEVILTATEHQLLGEDQLRAVADRLGVPWPEVLYHWRGVVADGSGAQAHIVITAEGVRRLPGQTDHIITVVPDDAEAPGQ